MHAAPPDAYCVRARRTPADLVPPGSPCGGTYTTYLRRAIMLIAHYLMLTCLLVDIMSLMSSCFLSRHTTLLYYLSGAVCTLNAIVIVFISRPCVLACIPSSFLLFVEPLLLRWQRLFPRHPPLHSYPRSLRRHSFFQERERRFALAGCVAGSRFNREV